MIFCYLCKEDTLSVEPFVIRRIENRISVVCLCKVCEFTKSRFLSTAEQNLLPFEIYMLKPKISYINKIKYKGVVYNIKESIKNIINH